ncbi:hypothetical protein Tco_1142481 [Tanacetum coccineum]
MSNLEDSTVTYTAVSSPFEEEPEQAPPLLEFVPELVYPEFMPPEDDVLPAEEQPLPAAVSHTANSPGYIPESDSEEASEEDDDEDPEEDPSDYPTDRDDDDEEEPSKDEADDEDEDKDDDEEEEEHPALVDSVPPPVHHTTARISISAQAPIPFLSEEEVERFLAIPTPPPSLLTPLSSPLPQIPSPPLPISPPLPVSSLPPPASPTYPLEFRAAMIRPRAELPSSSHSPPPIILSHTRAPMTIMRATAQSTYTLSPRSETPPSGTPPLLPIPLPTPSPPLLLPSTDRRAEMPEVCLPPRKRLCIAQGPIYEIGESSSAPRPTGGFRTDYGFVATLDAEIRRDRERDVGYGITDTWDEMLVGMLGAPTTDDTKLGRRMTEFATMVRQDTYEIYGRLDEAHDARAVLSGRLNLLQRDRCSYAYIDLLIEREARLSCEAWGRSMAASEAARSEVMVLRTTMLGQQAEIAALRAADRTRQA